MIKMKTKYLIAGLIFFVLISGCAPRIKYENTAIQPKEVTQEVLNSIKMKDFSFIGSYGEAEEQTIVEGRTENNTRYIALRNTEGLHEYMTEGEKVYTRVEDDWEESGSIPAPVTEMFHYIALPSAEVEEFIISDSLIFEENGKQLIKTGIEKTVDNITNRIVYTINANSLKPYRIHCFEQTGDKVESSWVVYEINEGGK